MRASTGSDSEVISMTAKQELVASVTKYKFCFGFVL